MPRTCEYVTLHGKRDFADMIKSSFYRWGDYVDGPNVIMWVFIREREAGQSEDVRRSG